MPENGSPGYGTGGLNEGVDSQVVDAVTINNVKVVGEIPALVTAQMLQNNVAHQNRVNVLAETALGQQIKSMQEVDPKEAASIQKMNEDLSSRLADLGAVVAALQQQMKGAQSTPPQTGGGSSD